MFGFDRSGFIRSLIERKPYAWWEYKPAPKSVTITVCGKCGGSCAINGERTSRCTCKCEVAR